MATTTPDNLWTPDSGDGYALTQDLAAFADTTQDALVVRANYYTGNNSQMANQESKATEGSVFYNTDDDKEYRLVSGAWVEEPSVASDSYNYRWDDSTARNAQSGMVAGDRGYQIDNGRTYQRIGSAWIPDPLFCTLGKTSNQNLSTSATALVWDSEDSDAGGMHNNSTNNTRITAPIAGTYEFSVSLFNSNTSGMGTVYARRNGTTDISGSLDRGTADSVAALPLQTVFPVVLSANDYVEIMVLHSTAAGTIAGGSTQGAARLTAKYLGPSGSS